MVARLVTLSLLVLASCTHDAPPAAPVGAAPTERVHDVPKIVTESDPEGGPVNATKIAARIIKVEVAGSDLRLTTSGGAMQGVARTSTAELVELSNRTPCVIIRIDKSSLVCILRNRTQASIATAVSLDVTP